MHRTSWLCTALIAALACSGGGATPTAPGAPAPAAVELDSYALVNEARAQNDVDPQLGLREALARVARDHSRSMRDHGFFGHVDPQGRTVADRLAEAGLGYRVVAENLARTVGIPNPAAWAHDQLMESSEHRPNILNPDFDLVGVGVIRDGSTYWITQVFVGE